MWSLSCWESCAVRQNKPKKHMEVMRISGDGVRRRHLQAALSARCISQDEQHKQLHGHLMALAKQAAESQSVLDSLRKQKEEADRCGSSTDDLLKLTARIPWLAEPSATCSSGSNCTSSRNRRPSKASRRRLQRCARTLKASPRVSRNQGLQSSYLYAFGNT